jgi:hypothetical protein
MSAEPIQGARSAAAFRLRRGVPVPESAAALDRRVRRRVGIAWGLLVLNAMAFAPGISIVPIPHRIGQAITQGALPLAILLALTVNRKVMVRPNVFLCLVSLLVVDTVITTLAVHSLGTMYRTFRLAEFVAALWLLTPWWGRRDLLLVRAHLVSLAAVLGSVLLGLLVAPGRAFVSGRLSGVLWPIPNTQVAHYAAIVAGLVAVLWLGGLVRGRAALPAVTAASAVLLLTHTRTAVGALIAGVIVASLSLFAARTRVRKSLAAAGVAASLAATTLGGVLTTWWARGESAQLLGSLSGRSNFWELVVTLPRSKFQEIFGFGMSNGSVNGLPIDSNWLESYMQQGLTGVAICVAMLLLLLVTAYFQPRGVPRALALFLVTYCLLASITEVGFTDATAYLLELSLAASLLIPFLPGRKGTRALPRRAPLS